MLHRLLDIKTDQNFVLKLDVALGFKANECVNFIAYSQAQGKLNFLVLMSIFQKDSYYCSYYYPCLKNFSCLTKNSDFISGCLTHQELSKVLENLKKTLFFGLDLNELF